MKIDNLKEWVLLEPAKNGFTELFIVSGYASATFLNSHLKSLLEINKDLKINLIIGMPGNRIDHLGYLSIDKNFPDRFSGYYLDHSQCTPCHSKLYAWLNKESCIGFSGSANYSQNGFDQSKQVNQMIIDDGKKIIKFFNQLKDQSSPMTEYSFDPIGDYNFEVTPGDINAGGFHFIDTKTVQISFLDRNGSLPQRSGLNWGQRPSREPNQAYLPIRGDARDAGFLPEHGRTFTLITDDSKSFDCVVAQQGRKAIETTNNNSLLGCYIRERLEIETGALVTKEHLIKYGRTDYILKVLDDETIYFDFKS